MSGFRVLLVNDQRPGPTGGVEVHLDRLVRGLEAAGDTVELFAGEITHTGPGKVLDLWDPWARRRLLAIARRFRPDVVHHHNVVRELSASVLGAPRAVPAVLTLHDHRMLGVPDSAGVLARGRAAKAVLDRRLARRRVAAVLAVSAPLADAARAAGFERVHVVSPLVVPPSPDLELREPEDCWTVVAAGRLAPEKGFDILIEAFTSIADRHRAARLVIAGEGGERRRLEALAAGLGPRVELPGQLEPTALQALMAEARVVVAPSVRREGAGLTVLEAAVVGRPVIVSDDPALRATAVGEPVVVPPGDVEALAAALDALLADPGRAAMLGRAARRAAAAHASTTGVDAVRQVYESVSRHR